MTNRQSIRLFFIMAFLLPGLAYAVVNLLEKKEKLPVFGSGDLAGRTRNEHSIEDFELLNQDGNRKSFHEWKGQIIVANFFFSHCPVVCPKMTANLQKISRQFQQEREIHIISISIDPERDSAAQLKKYANRFSIDEGKWDLLTGDKKEIYRLARNSFMVVATDGDGGPNDFIHSDKLVLIDKIGRIRGFYDGTDESAINNLSNDIKKLQDEN
jgi:protein SCO1/2